MALRRIDAATVDACPLSTASALAATHASVSGSLSGKNDQAEDHRYSSTWMKSQMIVTDTLRAFASALTPSIWCLAPSTRATRVRSCPGSRRHASSKIDEMSVAASSTMLAVSHLFSPLTLASPRCSPRVR